MIINFHNSIFVLIKTYHINQSISEPYNTTYHIFQFQFLDVFGSGSEAPL